MDILSILLFFIYSLLILGILVYVSPLISAVVMILIPVVFVLILPDWGVRFVSITQFSYSGIQVFNLHIMLIIWSAFIGIISYAEVLTWYLLREPEHAVKDTAHVVKDAMTAGTTANKTASTTAGTTVTTPPAITITAPAGDQPKTLVFKIKDFLEKLYKILRGEKIKLKP